MGRDNLSHQDYMEIVKDAARAVGNSQPGRVLLEYLAAKFFMGSSVLAPGKPDQTAFNEGNRFVVLHILALGGLTKMEEIIKCLTPTLPLPGQTKGPQE